MQFIYKKTILQMSYMNENAICKIVIVAILWKHQ